VIERGDLDLSRLTFKFAKTMPETPHWYVIMTAANEADFLALFHAVKEHGVDERWGRATYRYWYPGDGFKYWASPPYLPACKCINRAKVDASRRWPAGSTPGLARLRANGRAERIRQAVLADQERALADAGAAIAADNSAALTAALAASRDSLIADEPNEAQFAHKKAPPTPEPAKPAALSEGATQLLRALFSVAGDGWIDQKAIPHGLPGRTLPGYLTGLTKRGLVEARWDGGGKFSARMTGAGAALMTEPAP
jgi:hypothetical protein